MKRSILAGTAAAVFLLMALSSPSSAGEDLSLKALVQKNIEASGGRDKLGQVQNLSFRSGNARFVVAANGGELKLSTGKDPVVTEVILVKDGRVQRNSYNTITDILDPEKTVYLTLARLYAGLFSLVKFEEDLKLEGLKSFGPEKLYNLTAKSGVLKVDFFLKPDDFHLKRLVLRGSTSEGDVYEVNTDFGPFEPVEGFNMPLTWFSSQVGTRGNLAEVTEVELNQPLPGDFFLELKVNVGATEAGPGQLKGNVLDFNSSPFGLMVSTNWRKNDIEKSGFRSGDKLTFLVEGVESEVIFYASPGEVPNRNELAQGARLMMPMPRGGDTYVVQFIAVETASIESKLKPLAPIEIKKK